MTHGGRYEEQRDDRGGRPEDDRRQFDAVDAGPGERQRVARLCAGVPHGMSRSTDRLDRRWDHRERDLAGLRGHPVVVLAEDVGVDRVRAGGDDERVVGVLAFLYGGPVQVEPVADNVRATGDEVHGVVDRDRGAVSGQVAARSRLGGRGELTAGVDELRRTGGALTVLDHVDVQLAAELSGHDAGDDSQRDGVLTGAIDAVGARDEGLVLEGSVKRCQVLVLVDDHDVGGDLQLHVAPSGDAEADGLPVPVLPGVGHVDVTVLLGDGRRRGGGRRGRGNDCVDRDGFSGNR